MSRLVPEIFIVLSTGYNIPGMHMACDIILNTEMQCLGYRKSSEIYIAAFIATIKVTNLAVNDVMTGPINEIRFIVYEEDAGVIPRIVLITSIFT